MKIGICGQMCSGKTSIANYIISKDNSYYITSFAKKLKEIAETLFNMKEKNRDLLINSFEDMGFYKYAPPDGAFYLYIDVSKVTNNSTELAIKLLKEAGVSSTPGTDFDSKSGYKFIRFSYAGSNKEIIEGAKRIDNWIKRKN